jgi:hypothetical protein
MTTRLRAEGLARARSHAQLLGGSRHLAAAEVVTTVVGVQAQDLGAAGLAVRARSRRATQAEVDGALAEGSLVLTWSLRGTRHLHAAEDLRWIIELVGPAAAAAGGARRRQLGLEGAAGEGAVRTLREALQRHGPLTRTQVKERLARVGVDPAGQAPIHVIRRAALQGVCVVVPDPGGEERFVLLDDIVPAGGHMGREVAAAELARRYLRGYGPATRRDFAAWSGLDAGTTRDAWTEIAGAVDEVQTPIGAVSVLRTRRRSMLAASRRAAPVRLLGAFDPLLLGYAGREPSLAADRAVKVNAGGGMIKPTVLADGRVAGTWSSRRKGASLVVRVDAFARPRPRVLEDLEREVRDLGRFLGTSADLEPLR